MNYELENFKEKLNLDDLFKRKSDIHNFIRQAQSDAAASKKEWLVIYKKTRRMALVMVGEPYNARPALVLNSQYYIYPLEEFLKLPDEVFYA